MATFVRTVFRLGLHLKTVPEYLASTELGLILNIFRWITDVARFCLQKNQKIILLYSKLLQLLKEI